MAISFAVRTDVTEGIRKHYKEAIDGMPLEKLVQEFFSYLDLQEESDSGNVFNPISISCCRCLMLEPLQMVLDKMKEVSKQLDSTEEVVSNE